MKIYINHVGSSVTTDSLSAIFSTYGSVSGVEIFEEGSGRSAIIYMPQSANAAEAISQLNGRFIDGMAIRVVPFTSNSSI